MGKIIKEKRFNKQKSSLCEKLCTEVPFDLVTLGIHPKAIKGPMHRHSQVLRKEYKFTKSSRKQLGKTRRNLKQFNSLDTGISLL